MKERARKKLTECLRSFVWILMFTNVCEGVGNVTSITPNYGSLNGETTLTIYGDFSADQFSQNDDPNVGNKVYFVSESDREYQCPVFPDGCTETQLVCYTPRGMKVEKHYVKVVVDGKTVEDKTLCGGNPTSAKCTYKPHPDFTPTIEKLTPQSGKLNGTMVTITGVLYTDIYGSNLQAATNNKTERLTRVYVGPQLCEVKNADAFYGFKLDSSDSNHGTLKCKTQGTSVGCFNASFIIQAPYGRSLSEVQRVSENNKICMFTSYTDITNISHSSGSKEGGLVLTICGHNYDNTTRYAAPRAYVGDTECVIQEVVVNGCITCKVAPDPGSTGSSFPGNRGVVFKYWKNTNKDMSSIDSIRALTSSSPGYNSAVLDETYFFDVNDTMDNYVSWTLAYFTPPRDGQYQFFLFADDGGKLLIDNVVATTSERTWGMSSLRNLNSNQSYLLEVLHFESTLTSVIHLKVKYFNTTFTSAWTNQAEQEKQIISITSQVKFEEQEIEFEAFSSQAEVGENQTIEVNTTGQFRFGMYGAYTGPLTTNMNADAIKAAINAMPIFGSGESVNVIRMQVATPTYQIVFDSKRGDYPDFQVVKVENNPPVTYRVTQNTAGIPDLDMAALLFAGVFSDPFSVSNLDASKLERATSSLFEAKCPQAFLPSTAKYIQSFEADSVQYIGNRVTDTEAFCGRYSLKDPRRIFKKGDDEDGISLAQYGILCFAYKGFLQNHIRLTFSYKASIGSPTVSETRYFPYSFKTDSSTESVTWYYTCIDVYDKLKAIYPSVIQQRLEEVRVFSLSADQSGYVDAVVISQKPTTEDPDPSKQRRRPALPNGAVIREAKVNLISGKKYKIILKPFDCGTGFPLFGIGNGMVQSGALSQPSSPVTLTLHNGNGKFIAKSVSTASPPTTGELDLQFKGETKTKLNISLEASDFAKELQSLYGIGSVLVTKEGDCANFNLSITILDHPGNQEEIKITKSSLSGSQPAASILTAVDGGLFYDPIPGGIVKTVESTTQVRLYINDILTSCETNCSFQWLTSKTPNVTAVTPATGTSALSTSIVITGTGFNNTDITKNTVTIGNVICAVTASTATTITCDVGNGPVGSHKIMVNVDGKGFARHPNGDVMFAYTAEITGISPTSGSLGGGVNLTISGYGFKSGSTVTISSADCTVLSIEPSEIVCIVPPKTSEGTHDVVVTQGSVTLTYQSYQYSISKTAVISSITPSTIGVLGTTLTISGTSFTGTKGSVHVGPVAATVVSWTDTKIIVNATSVPAGTNTLFVMAQHGYATNSSWKRPDVYRNLILTNVFPRSGSILGGTKLTITGSGFGTNGTIIAVSVGDVECKVDTVIDSQIVCEIKFAAKTHNVTNKGTDPAFGKYYAFDKPTIKINAGDYVHWSWETPAFVKSVAHAIIEVEQASSKTAKPGGFSSGTPTANGYFSKQFTMKGDYHVWSGFVDTWNIKSYSGTILVDNAMSRIEEIRVKVAGIEALHNVGGANDPSDTSQCQAVTTKISSCSDSWPTGGKSGRFNFAFWTCSTPTVSSIDVNNGTVKTSITVSGKGLSGSKCQNEVSFGGYKCNVTSLNDSSVTCHLEKSGEPDLGVLHLLSLKVHNRGNALVEIMPAVNKTLRVIPNIETVTPTAGSMAGGAHVRITGFGFGDSPQVNIGGITCNIINSSYTVIVCESPPSDAGERDIEVKAYVSGNPIMAKCETSTKTCRYTYAQLWTPSVTAVQPDSVSNPTVITITGTSLGTSTSELKVMIGGVNATVTSASNTLLKANIANIPAGDNNVVVRVSDLGKASGNLKVYGTPVINSLVPTSGSIYGKTLITIQGNGFVKNDTNVTLDGSECVINSTSLSEVICETKQHAAGSVSLGVKSNGVTYTPSSYSFSTDSTPTISSLNPLSGIAGNTLTISGSNLNGGEVTVSLDDANCDVSVSTSSQILCTLGSHPTGSVPVSVHVAGKGRSNVDKKFEYQLTLSSISPNEGSTGGGQTVVLSGTGFNSLAVVTICGQNCTLKDTNSSQYMCRTPPNTAQTCDVSVSLSGIVKSLENSYSYNAALTPTCSGVSPSRGGTGGGTSITISGSGFGSVVNDVNVMIDDVECDVSTVTDTEIVCVTGPHLGSVDAKVEVQISGNGIAKEETTGDADFSYIDVWSSPYTWGGGPVPEEGDFIIIPRGMTLLLDTDTPVLSFLLIQGGKLIFDETDVELKAKVIMITDRGVLQVGTESEPFRHKAIITLYGTTVDKELPIYGTKVLAVRNGTLDLHGIEMPLTWTTLASTATAGSSSIVLKDPVEWNVGDEIVIASTGHKHSQSENEKKTISNKSSDNRTLTLDSALDHKHWGTQETVDGTVLEFRAEVGLLTHNVVVRGDRDAQWDDKIEACEEGFDTGEFATQTCFLGRFGDEIGSSQFGAMILVHAPVYDTHEAQARISYTEITFAGQAFRLGRYPVHFHLNGDMSTSYVRGCGIHHTFNRAVNIHGTHNTLVEKTVIYNIMGGAFFLEDGIETGNTMQYNLAVFVRASSSLLNDDVTPASYWVTNPNNTIQHNAAAGGSHFGYWYRMHGHPDGPSFTETVCPIAVPLGVFLNNSAHSFGWFGLWIFPDYFPKKDACGGTEVEPAVFDGLYAWNNDKGAEAVNSGALQFKNFVLVQNKLAGYEGKLVMEVPLYTDDAPMIADSLIVGTTTVIPDSDQGCTKGGIIFPYGAGFRAVNIRFVNFADSSCATFRFTRIDGTCGDLCGGYTYHAEGLKFVNSPNKAVYAWEWEGIIVDKDGSATGKAANWAILPTTGTLPTDCESAPEYSHGIAASMCPPPYHKWHRFSFNKASPQSLEGRNFMITNQYGTSSCPFAEKRISHGLGWALALLDGSTYTFEFEGAGQINNISFSGQFEHFEASEYVFMEMVVEVLPDRFSFDGGETYINATVGGIDPSTAENGDWEWDNTNSKVKFIVHGNKRSRRSSPGMSTYSVDRAVSFTAYKCYYENCIPPPDPDTVPPATERPLDFDIWDDTTLWNNSNNDSFVSNTGGSYGLPQDYDDVRITFGSWVVVNKTTPFSKLGTLLLEGVLEFFDTLGAVYEIEADFIIIKGGRLIIGWPDDAFDGLATITLRGNHSSPYYYTGDGPILGSKAIGVFGGLDLFGKDVGRTWTELAITATAGSNTVVLADQVQWSQGDEIVIGPTGFDPWQTESFKIQAVATDNVTLTLNSTLKYLHTAHHETLPNGQEIKVGAAVGMLSRNIKIVGQDYDDLYKESFGVRVLVGLVTSQGQAYTGYARLSNVEFYHTGQEGFTDEYDPRYSLAYLATGSVSHVKPSFVSKCSFHNGFSTAIGAFGIASLNITDNVIFGAIGHGLRTSSEDTRLINNLLALVVSTVTYQDRFEVYDYESESGIEAISATDLTLQDNLVTGAERIAFHVPPQDCDDTSDKYKNNKAYANVLGGVVITYHDVLKQTDCAKMAGHTVWKTHDYGIYYQHELNLLVEDNLLIENTNGLFPIIIRPPSLSHLYVNKTMQVRSTTFVGETSSFDCSNDVANYKDHNYQLSSNARPSFPPSGGKVGLIFPGFYSAGNGLPSHPWKGIMSYPALGGLMILKNITFAKYRSTSCKSNFAVSTNSANDDLMHPVVSKESTLIEVDESNKIVYHRPNVGKINSADCVDMDCDGQKKALFKDLDGTFLGFVGSVIPNSAYEWDGDPRRGLGDYRIPKTMLTDKNGDRIPVDTIAPHKGIIGNENCTYHTGWQAYGCKAGLNYEMLIIESMDADTETRRLSPVALLGDGYIDLINGPQDHGWCSGYTCRLRVSTFFALVATDKEYLMHFTSKTPEDMRYRLLNVESDKSIKLSVWYAGRSRLDVYVDGVYVKPTNVRIDDNGRHVFLMGTGDEFQPQIGNGTGTNYFDKDSGLLTLIIQGLQRIDVRTQASVIVTFGLPDLTLDEFFGDNIVENLATFLNIPLDKVKVVNAVYASSTSRRRKRSSETGIVVELEIADEPTSDINATAPDSIDYTSLTEIAANIVNECQVGNISESFNVTGFCESVSLPSLDSEIASVEYSAPTPDHLFIFEEPVSMYEGILLQTQPKLRVADIMNNWVTELGTDEFPWQLTASLRAGTGHPDAVLNGTLLVTCSNGWFNFTDLAISHMGTGYIIDFNISYPTQANTFHIASNTFDVPGRSVKIHVFDQTNGDIVLSTRFSVTLDLRDLTTEDIITDIAWRGHTWTAEASLLGSSPYADLEGHLASSFDTSTGRAMFPDLNITGFGIYYVQFRVVSDPPDFNLTLNHKLNIKLPSHVDMIVEEQYEVQIKFDADFNTLLNTEDKQNEFEQMVLADISNRWHDVSLSGGSVQDGSIVVTFVISGTYSSVNSTAYSLCDSIYNETSYSFDGYSLTLAPYMTINGQAYYGVTCGELSEDEETNKGMADYLIAVIVLICILVVAVIFAFAFWRYSVNKTKRPAQVFVKPLHFNKTSAALPSGNFYNGKKSVEDFLFRADSESSMSQAPLVTALDMGPRSSSSRMSGTHDTGSRSSSRMSGFSLRVNSPEPVNMSRVSTQYPSYGIVNPPPTYNDSYFSLPDERNRFPRNKSSSSQSRSHSAVSDRESPLPPVGQSLHSSDFI
ncbi:fibrocystin-L-like isoform X2 [Mercenaria mercenaria]|uniref:fibrocystin-L-like isoform X2 n=1 Tax=Mercenaria mercenaria TaxID=6596 RepID=UPI00234EE1A2|nr:fibrocystin-L-like isoform X2 [Mercenaria mercenaria]